MRKQRIKLSDQIRQAVESSDLSRNAIARATGIDKGVLSRFVAGKVGMLMENMDMVADLLGLDVITIQRRNKVMRPFDDYPNGGSELLGKPKDVGNCRHGKGLELQRLSGQTICAYCGINLTDTYEHWLLMSVDHVVPGRDKGDKGLGINPEWIEDFANLVLCCSACNQFLQEQVPMNTRKPKSFDEFVNLRNEMFEKKKQKAKSRHDKECSFYTERPWTKRKAGKK